MNTEDKYIRLKLYTKAVYKPDDMGHDTIDLSKYYKGIVYLKNPVLTLPAALLDYFYWILREDNLVVYFNHEYIDELHVYKIFTKS